MCGSNTSIPNLSWLQGVDFGPHISNVFCEEMETLTALL
jgi:hypothetical protein